MLNLIRRSSWTLLVVLVSLLLPSAAYAQAAITGVVKDASGGVLPGVTVEAASPVLIEKVRSVVTDATGQYRIVDLRPGTYSVTFTLPGFSTVKREGIELSGNFVATVNADLKVGALEETITVTGETPIVDVQSARMQQIISKDVSAAIPSSRNAGGLQALIPGMQRPAASASSGIRTPIPAASGIDAGRRRRHPRRPRERFADLCGRHQHGVGRRQRRRREHAARGRRAGSGADHLGRPRRSRDERRGPQRHPARRGEHLQRPVQCQRRERRAARQQLHAALKAKGLRSPSELIRVYDVNPMGGGRIVRDKLWFYAAYRQTGGESTVPGMCLEQERRQPECLDGRFRQSKPAFTNRLERQATMRLTWQATPRNKFNMHWAEQYLDSNYGKGGGAETAGQLTTPEATPRSYYIPSRQPHATLVVADLGPAAGRGRLGHVSGAVPLRAAQRRHVQPADDPGAGARRRGPESAVAGARSACAGGFAHSLIGKLANMRASLSYVTGAHNMKFGYQGGFSNPSQTYNYPNQVIQIRMSDGVPNQLTQTVVVGGHIKYVRNLMPTNFYAQDQWTPNRLTLQGGVRYDSPGLELSRLARRRPRLSVRAGGDRLSERGRRPGTSGTTSRRAWASAYDLFGNGKTAIKFNLGKYMEAITATNTDLDMNPLIRTASARRATWTDYEQGLRAELRSDEPGGERRMRSDGQPEPRGGRCSTAATIPNFVTGWGIAAVQLGPGLSVQQEVVPRVSVNVGYFRNWWGNWYVVDNRATSLADYTPFSIVAPRRSAAAGRRRLHDRRPVQPRAGQGRAGGRARAVLKNFAEQIENWQGVDVNVVARLRNGLTVQGGTSTGRRLADACAVRAKLPELGAGPTGPTNSSVTANVTGTTADAARPVGDEPLLPHRRAVQDGFRGLATYTVPRVDVQVAARGSSDPGDDLAANFVADNA